MVNDYYRALVAAQQSLEERVFAQGKTLASLQREIRIGLVALVVLVLVWGRR